MGDEIAEQLGEVWGFGGDGELKNMWRRTPQPGMWFVGGGLPQVRIYSRFLALQIKAVEEGMIEPTLPDERRAPDEEPQVEFPRETVTA